MSRTRLSVLLVLVLAATAMACGVGGSPGSVIKDFYKKIDRGEVSSAMEFLSKTARTQFGDAMLQPGLNSLSETARSKGGIASVKITEEKVHGETASVSFVITYKDGTTKSDSEKMIKEDGRWRIAASK